MLTHFPTPYPNEWWYSVLCRYHVRSGYSKNQTTVGELFGGKVLAQMGALFPNSTILRVYDQLPQDIFRIRNCVIKNTLFPYFTRFYTQQEKENMLSQIAAQFFRYYSLFQTGHLSLTELARLADISRPTAYKYIHLINEQGGKRND